MLNFQQNGEKMKKFKEILLKCPLFDGISEENLYTMLGCLGARVISFDKKYTIFAEGSRATHIGILLSGEAQVMLVDYYGNRSIVGNVTEGDIFAEAFACAELDTLPVTVIASEPSEVMLIDCSHIMHTCNNNCGFHQQLIFNLMKDIARKNIALYKKNEITAKRTTRDKLISYLSLEAKRSKSSSFDIPYDRQELADYLGVDRSGLSTEIGKLRDEGIIDTHRSRFTIL